MRFAAALDLNYRGLGAAWRRHSADLAAGITGGIASVPDGMAAGLIIGVSPIHGLYASIVGPIIGGLTSRTPLLMITTTSASALAAAEVIRGAGADTLLDQLLLLTLIAGAIQVIAGAFGLARLTAFVSHSVMTGFLIGIAVLIIVGQAGTFLGYEAEGGNAVTKTAGLGSHIAEVQPATIAIGLLTIAIILMARRARLGAAGALLALAVPSLLVALLGLDQVATVVDVGEIPAGLPLPAIPDLGLLSVSSLTGALALAAVIFVQTAGVSQSLPGSGLADDHRRDLIASGLANMSTAFVQGQPVGGSLSQSALNIQSGARTRLAAILAGGSVLVIVLLFSGLVEQVAMASLAGLLIVAAFGAIDGREAASIWQAGWSSRLTIVTTFCLTLLLPIQLAVGAGVVLSGLLYLSAASTDVHIVELVQLPGRAVAERAPPTELPSGSVTVLQVYGSLFYAGARTMARRLPSAAKAERAVVILRLRGKTRLGATATEVLASYAGTLREHEGRLYLAGLTPSLKEQLTRGRKLQLAGVRLYPAVSIVGKSLSRSYADAQAWLVRGAGNDIEP